MYIILKRLVEVANAITATCLLGCGHANAVKSGAGSVTILEPAYFGAMKRGSILEHRKDYTGAIKEYESAIGLSDGVYVELRTKARIAAHNRIGACYRDLDNVSGALREFRISVGLGDLKFAPKAVEKLRRSRANSR